MRGITANMRRKLASRMQAGNSELSASLWVARPTTPLTESSFLEKQSVLNASGITKTSVAVCHPRLSRDATQVYIGYIKNGRANVVSSTYNDDMMKHIWVDTGFDEPASDVALCFDGTMPRSASGYVEFKTEDVPYVFFVVDNQLYCRKLDSNDNVLLAEANCTAVSAVRALWSGVGGYDFGLVAFFIVGGQLFYRQLIKGEWCDAEAVSYGPDNKIWVDLASFRTWDYRVGVQLKASDGTVYELITQFMGIAKQMTEHIGIDANIQSDVIEVNINNLKSDEHIDIDVSVGAPHGGLYSALPPLIDSVYNVADEYGDWGHVVMIRMDNWLVQSDEIQKNLLKFSLVDELGVSYIPSEIHLLDDELTIKLTFSDINNARGTCRIKYTGGTLITYADVLMLPQEFTFVPSNLVPSSIPVPEVESIWNA